MPTEPRDLTDTDPAAATEDGDDGPRTPTLVVVYASGIAEVLARWGRDLGRRTVLVEPDPDRVTAAHRAAADEVVADPVAAAVDDDTDVVVCDHHRDDLGPVLAPLLAAGPRWIGIVGNPRSEGPHVAALRAEGVAEDAIATVRRPIGLDLGPTHQPAEIALSTLAELVADRGGALSDDGATATRRRHP